MAFMTGLRIVGHLHMAREDYAAAIEGAMSFPKSVHGSLVQRVILLGR